MFFYLRKVERMNNSRAQPPSQSVAVPQKCQRASRSNSELSVLRYPPLQSLTRLTWPLCHQVASLTQFPKVET